MLHCVIDQGSNAIKITSIIWNRTQNVHTIQTRTPPLHNNTQKNNMQTINHNEMQVKYMTIKIKTTIYGN
jgi:hypothetical protein